eukprot:Pgem_evm1s6709
MNDINIIIIIVLFLDITSQKSFESIGQWMKNIEQHASGDVEKMILGNKCDMEDSREVSTEAGAALAQEYGIKFYETSAKESNNIECSFIDMAEAIKKSMDTRAVSAPAKPQRGVVDPNSAPKKGF